MQLPLPPPASRHLPAAAAATPRAAPCWPPSPRLCPRRPHPSLCPRRRRRPHPSLCPRRRRRPHPSLCPLRRRRPYPSLCPRRRCRPHPLSRRPHPPQPLPTSPSRHRPLLAALTLSRRPCIDAAPPRPFAAPSVPPPSAPCRIWVDFEGRGTVVGGDFAGGSLVFFASVDHTSRDWAVSPCMPPLPEGVIPREALEEDESESTVPFDVEEEAPESSSPDTRKRSRSEDSDASSPSTPEGAGVGAELPIPAVPVSAMAPSSSKKMWLPKESSSESGNQTFDFDKFDCQQASSSSGDVQFLKESRVATSRAKKEVERAPSSPLAAHSRHNSSSSPHDGEHRMVARMTAHQSTSESLEDHLLVEESAHLVEQVLAMGRQHAMLDTRYRVVENEHNALLHDAATMEKTLIAAVKSRDEAIVARDEAQKREEDLCHHHS